MTETTVIRAATIALAAMIVIPAGFAFVDPFQWNGNILLYFVVSLCLGIPLAILTFLYATRIRQLSTMSKAVGLLVLCTAGGTAGIATGRMMGEANFTPLHFTFVLVFNLVLSVLVGGFAFVYFALRDKASRMALALKENEAREAKLRQLKAQAELESLQTKVNPHFLFNALNSIASLISENPAAAEAMTEKLAELFRYTLQSTERSTVTLIEELEIVRLYLEIEKVRFGARLTFTIDHDPRLNDVHIPALLIQPLAENAIKHGIAPAEEGGTITVDTKLRDGTVTIAVTDSGRGFSPDSAEAGFGLKSIRERLLLLYGAAARLEAVHNGNTQIRITIPLS